MLQKSPLKPRLTGNQKEAARGYGLCIKANPHTHLAQRAKTHLVKIESR
ncbi:MAG: hypothetical protein GY765_07675 [bacterium]|nr:hypothetical protein [bacterium]